MITKTNLEKREEVYASRETRRWYSWSIAILVSSLAALALLPQGHAQAATADSQDLAVSTLNSNSLNSNLGLYMVGLGDVNGDGIKDVAISNSRVSGSTNSGSVWVLFGPKKNISQANLNDLPASQGYRIAFPASRGPNGLTAAGDKNGDGIQDVIVNSSGGQGDELVFNVADPADPVSGLPFCDGVGTIKTRCVNFADPVNISGQRIGAKLVWGGKIVALQNSTSGDVNDDGNPEVLLTLAQVTGSGLAFSIGVVTDVDLSSCPPSGLCTVDLGTQGAPKSVELVAPSGKVLGSPTFSIRPAVLGDVNGDGINDIGTSFGTDGATPPDGVIIFGDDWQDNSVEVDPEQNAIAIPGPFAAGNIIAANAGDVNGDGSDDVLFNIAGIVGDQLLSVWTGGQPSEGDTLAAPGDNGFLYGQSESGWVAFNSPTEALPLGDLNGDGAEELAFGAGGLGIDGQANSGAVRILFGHKTNPTSTVQLGPGTPASDMVTVAGGIAGGKFGTAVAPAGDWNGDGLDDLYVSSPGAATTDPGKVDLLTTSGLVARAVTGQAGSVTSTGGALGGVAKTNGRQSDAYFEYGATDAYGQSTTPQDIGDSNGMQSVDADVTGLQPDSDTHYRLVVENDLGVKAYGVDRTFKTAATPKTGCDLDDTGYGCAKFCEAHPDAGDCIDPVAGLSDLIASSSASKVRRGGKVVVRTWITSTGTKEASGVKVCASGPKRLVRIQGKACRSFGNVAPGRTVKAQFTVKVKPKAKRRARAALKFVATSQELGNKTAQVKVAVR